MKDYLTLHRPRSTTPPSCFLFGGFCDRKKWPFLKCEIIVLAYQCLDVKLLSDGQTVLGKELDTPTGLLANVCFRAKRH